MGRRADLALRFAPFASPPRTAVRPRLFFYVIAAPASTPTSPARRGRDAAKPSLQPPSATAAPPYLTYSQDFHRDRFWPTAPATLRRAQPQSFSAMNSNLVEIAFILDRSGSMDSVREQAISGFNHFLADQAKQPGDARLTLVLFDDEYLVPADALPLRDVAPLNANTYVPRNSTALLDAIGLTIDRLGQRLAHTPEPERPGQVIVAILTDGLENASTRYTWQDVAARIHHQQEKYSWRFLFLGANQDAIATAAQMNIDAANAATFAADAKGVHASTRSISRRTRALRRAVAGNPADPDLAKPMQEIVAEENTASPTAKI